MSGFSLEKFNFVLLFPVLSLLFWAIVLLLLDAFKKLSRNFYIGASVIALFSALCFLLLYNGFVLDNSHAFFGLFVSDNYAIFAQIVILVFSMLYLLMDKDEQKAEFFSLFLFMIASLILMISSTNLIVIFLALEGSSLALYTLIALRGTHNAISSSIKYFTLAAVGAGFFVFACAFVYLKTKSLDLDNLLYSEYISDPILLCAGVMFLVIVGVKLSIAPFHFWLKDVYCGVHTNFIAFISIVPKIAMIIVVLRIFSALGGGVKFEYIVALLAIFSMLVVSIVALIQKDVKKMLAYSSITHSSFILAVIVSSMSVSSQGDGTSYLLSIFALFVYWISFAFANYGIFLILSLFQKSSFESFSGLFNQRPVLSIMLAIFILCIAGIPPFGIFWGKILILASILNSGYYVLIFAIALSSMIMLYAYLKILIYVFFKKAQIIESANLDVKQKIILCLCLIGSVSCVFLLL
ncbi:NADH-quinone oxidoreductase subunit N [Campylobacter lari]|uniref:NADH-quinone oxidoreductase subunit N n=1 Tax=Campylobacter TaxID=194 RepID=UPI0012712645|nr:MULTISPECIES: NADH-quinone oxidoreductase subunit N [Campylobacter]EAI0281536.1 NADH-quinone oxidoreductase subunit N [Campylobacter lari]EAK0303763.1 NADH-quinone oxidoreductase subunit N [Campylobacter lari]EAK0793579.1 NADH-quinone oxidoreductase subunit N [Campylobacter lari]EAL5648889.1 NADH-quinone oxidoreductase subunit N [Campylobacter lari]EAL9302006.1 NADH-quinone oxidoreductase subunit N [Campylobacter lari]